MVLWVRAPRTEKVRWRQSLTAAPHPRSLQVTPAVFTSLPLSSSCFFPPKERRSAPSGYKRPPFGASSRFFFSALFRFYFLLFHYVNTF